MEQMTAAGKGKAEGRIPGTEDLNPYIPESDRNKKRLMGRLEKAALSVGVIGGKQTCCLRFFWRPSCVRPLP